jgi:hypothetical protein
MFKQIKAEEALPILKTITNQVLNLPLQQQETAETLEGLKQAQEDQIEAMEMGGDMGDSVKALTQYSGELDTIIRGFPKCPECASLELQARHNTARAALETLYETSLKVLGEPDSL